MARPPLWMARSKQDQTNMAFSQIDRDLLDRIRELENLLMKFRAYRHLWAELVANHIECGVPRKKLEENQWSQLSNALSQAYSIAKELGIEWQACEITREESLRRLRRVAPNTEHPGPVQG